MNGTSINDSTKVVVTGIGTCSSLGRNVTETEENLALNRVNFKDIPEFRFKTENPILRIRKCFQIPEESYLAYKAEDLSVMYPMAKDCIQQAVSSAGLTTSILQEAKTSFCIGMSVSTTFVREKVIYERFMNNSEAWDEIRYTTPVLASKMAKDFGVNGVVSVISTACASGTNSIGRAFDLIRSGRADYVICGGIDLVSELAFNGFNSLLALSRERCKPFGIERDGMSLGDGCAMFVLESYESAKQRGATVYAEVKGYHILNETYHPTSPHPDGIYALSCMKSALEMAHLNIEDVDYINAHGTGTKINDSSEFKAINDFLVNRQGSCWVNSTKGLTGHTLGAAGSMEALLCILSMKNNIIYGDGRDYETLCSSKVDYINQNLNDISVNVCVSNSFAFAGNMSSIVLSKI